jgi:hypothetical protein
MGGIALSAAILHCSGTGDGRPCPRRYLQTYLPHAQQPPCQQQPKPVPANLAAVELWDVAAAAGYDRWVCKLAQALACTCSDPTLQV